MQSASGTVLAVEGRTGCCSFNDGLGCNDHNDNGTDVETPAIRVFSICARGAEHAVYESVASDFD